MAGTLAKALAGVEVGEGIAVGSLTFFPLTQKHPAEPEDVAVLEEGISSGSVVVTEVSEGGSVPDVFVENHLSKPLFILEGEEIIGAKQNRIFNISLLIPAAAALKVPVSCVEAGRWHRQSRRFDAGARATARVQRDLKRSVNFSARREKGLFMSDQSQVWQNVSESLSAIGAESESSAMNAAYESRASDLKKAEVQLTLPADCVGAVIAEADRIISVELFADSSLWQRCQKRILRSFLLEASRDDVPKRAGREEALEFLKSVGKMKCSVSPSPGNGSQHRADTDAIAASALKSDGKIYHLSAIA